MTTKGSAKASVDPPVDRVGEVDRIDRESPFIDHPEHGLGVFVTSADFKYLVNSLRSRPAAQAREDEREAVEIVRELVGNTYGIPISTAERIDNWAKQFDFITPTGERT